MHDHYELQLTRAQPLAERIAGYTLSAADIAGGAAFQGRLWQPSQEMQWWVHRVTITSPQKGSALGAATFGIYDGGPSPDNLRAVISTVEGMSQWRSTHEAGGLRLPAGRTITIGLITPGTLVVGDQVVGFIEGDIWNPTRRDRSNPLDHPGDAAPTEHTTAADVAMAYSEVDPLMPGHSGHGPLSPMAWR